MYTTKWLACALVTAAIGVLTPSQSQAFFGLFSCGKSIHCCPPVYCCPPVHCCPPVYCCPPIKTHCCLPMHCCPPPVYHCPPVHCCPPMHHEHHHHHGMPPAHHEEKKDPHHKGKEKMGYYPTPGYDAVVSTPAVKLAVIARHDLLTGKTSEHAESLFARGFTAYFDGYTEQAVEYFAAALTLNDNDVRSWYYLALAQRQLGQTATANESAQIGAATEATQTVSKEELGRLMERIQGEPRQFLTTAKDTAGNATAAREILAGKKQYLAKHIHANTTNVAAK